MKIRVKIACWLRKTPKISSFLVAPKKALSNHVFTRITEGKKDAHGFGKEVCLIARDRIWRASLAVRDLKSKNFLIHMNGGVFADVKRLWFIILPNILLTLLFQNLSRRALP